MPTETVTVTISGANGPQTKTVSVNVNSGTGSGTAIVSWAGPNFGLDNIVATAVIAGQNLTSNTAQHRWGYNDTPVSINTGSGFNSNTFWGFTVIGVFPDGTTTGPSQTTVTGNTHFNVAWGAIPGVSYYNVYCIQSVQGSAGSVTATIGKLHGSGSGNGGNNSSTEGGGGPNYPPSVTQLWMDNGQWFPFSGDGTAPPATNTSLLAPSLATPTGKLTITPQGTASVVGGTQALTISISGINYTSIPYIPVYETVSGSLPLYNNGSSFVYPAYNSQAVDKAAAATNAWAISGDTTGTLSVQFNGTNFVLNYNGGNSIGHTDVSTITITADDIAWFFNANKTYDVFTNSGGISTQVLVEYLVKASIASVSPTTVGADGASHVFAVTLTRPLSPRQLGTQYNTGNSFSASFSMVGGTVTNTQAVFDGSGWLTGWNVTVTIPSSTSNGTATLSANIGGTLTYLNGSSFTTGPVSYVNGPVATINLTGTAYTNPTPYSFSASDGPSWPYTLSSITLTGVVFQQQNNPITMQFIGVNQSNNTQFNIVSGSQINRVTGTDGQGHNGWLTTFAGTVAPASIPPSPGAIIGFTATDSTSGLSCQYLTSTVYFFTPPSGGGGGGGGGCFNDAVAIWTPDGCTEFGSLPTDRPFEITNQTGTHMAELIIHENYKGWMIKLASGKLVTLDHLMKLTPEGTEWLGADQKYRDYERVWFEGTVYNLHVITNDPKDQHYILFNGDVAHNVKIANPDGVF